MAKINYNEISKMFPQTYYSSDYWHQKSWEFVDEYGLNEYNNLEEKFKVYLRVATLGMIYLDFFKNVYDEDYDYTDVVSEFKSKIKDEFKDEEIREIIKPYNINFQREEYNEYADDDEEEKESEEETEPELDFDAFEIILLELGDKERKNLIEILEKDMGELKTCVAIYCSAKTMDDIDYDDEDEDEEDEEDEDNIYDEERYLNSLLSTKDYESFWTSMNKNFQEIYDNLVFSDFSPAYEWWKNGAYQLG